MDNEVISYKISNLQYYLSELKKADDITWDQYRKDIRSKAFVERFLHLCIEEVLDICNRLIAFNQWREPQSFRDLFNILNEHNVINHSDLSNFQQMASFRNLLVHRYEKIEDEIVYGIFSKRLKDFEKFIEAIKVWIRSK